MMLSVLCDPISHFTASMIVLSTTDNVDECAQSLHDCDTNATCINSVGSYSCQCNAGFQGDGRSCIGWLVSSIHTYCLHLYHFSHLVLLLSTIKSICTD